MIERPSTAEELLLRLRRDFDDSFASLPVARIESPLDLLAIGVGTEHVVVHASAIAALRVDVRITAVPTPLSSLLGITGIAGAIVAVHDLAKVLGFPSGPSPRWVALMRHAPIAFAFASFDRHLRVSTDSIAPNADGTAGPMCGELVLNDGNRLPVIDCELITQDLTARARSALGGT